MYACPSEESQEGRPKKKRKEKLKKKFLNETALYIKDKNARENHEKGDIWGVDGTVL